jgi:hypothetical protein
MWNLFVPKSHEENEWKIPKFCGQALSGNQECTKTLGFSYQAY